MDDRWLDIKALSAHSSISARTLRRYIQRQENPLPHHRLGTRKILVRQSVFDAWLAAQSPERRKARNEELARQFTEIANRIRAEYGEPVRRVNVQTKSKKPVS